MTTTKQPELPTPKRERRTLDQRIADLQQKQREEQLRLQLRHEYEQLGKDIRAREWDKTDEDIAAIGMVIEQLKALRGES